METYKVLSPALTIVQKVVADDYRHENGYFVFYSDNETKVYAVHEKYVHSIKVESN